jgi:hypothetical protein
MAPSGSHYLRSLRALEARGAYEAWLAVRLTGIAQGLRADYQAGYLTKVEELIDADLFADFLEMADELLSKGYK